MKYCSKCKVTKPYVDFNKNKSTKDGYHSQCRVCEKEYKIQYSKTKNGKLHIQEYQKKYNKINDEKIRERNRKYYKLNIEVITQNVKSYRKTKQGKLVKNVSEHRRRNLLKINTLGKHHTTKDIKLKFKLQYGKCVYCQTSIKDCYHIDHVIPVSRGGGNEASNIQLLCGFCNLSKSDRLAHEFAPKYGKLF